MDGKLTRGAFEQQVKPVLAELPELVRGLPVVEDEKTRFSNFVLKQAIQGRRDINLRGAGLCGNLVRISSTPWMTFWGSTSNFFMTGRTSPSSWASSIHNK